MNSLVQRMKDGDYLKLTEELARSSVSNIPWLIDTMFSPRQIIAQMVMISVLQSGILMYKGLHESVKHFWNMYISNYGRNVLEMEKAMDRCEAYEDWLKIAQRLDTYTHAEEWRHDDSSTLYDKDILIKRIKETERYIRKGDVQGLIFKLRGGLIRDQYGKMDERLYVKAVSGTKILIEKYNSTMVQALDYICDTDDSIVPFEDKLSFFNETRHAYGHTALLLSGGAYLGYYHMGVFKSLWLQGLMPKIISGASAGSLMAAIIGTKDDEELRGIFSRAMGAEGIDHYRRDYFKISNVIKSEWGRNLQHVIPRSLSYFTDPLLAFIFDGKVINLDLDHLKEVVLENVGTYTFQEAFDRTGRIINITVAPSNQYDPPRLLNYLTAPHICVWSAAVASCAIPGFFDPCHLVVKEPAFLNSTKTDSYSELADAAELNPLSSSRFRSNTNMMNVSEDSKRPKGLGYSDGSIESDLPMQQLSELFNVNHFIISQVNPHSSFLSSLSLRGRIYKSIFHRILCGITQFLKEQCKSWLKNIGTLAHCYQNDLPLWSIKRGFHSVLTQNYEGRENDITIQGWVRHLSVVQAWASIIKVRDIT